jgi:DNA invertase Pin-like site-specific DNA recombinase
MRILAYVRISKDDDDESQSPEAQEKAVRDWAARLPEPAEVITFREKAISGKKIKNRPELQKLLAAVEKGDAVVAYSLSRLSRSTIDMLNMAEMLHRRGANIVSLTEPIDTTTAAGEMIFGVLAVFAQFERKVISERTRAVFKYKKSRGEHTGGSYTPFGYRARGRMLVKDDEEQRVIKRIRSWHRRGMSLRFIARRLEDQGVCRRAGGSTWCATSVRRVLSYM